MATAWRGQSETVGVLLLTGVFVILAALIGMFVLSSMTSDAQDDGPLVDVEANATADYVSVSHAGGDSIRATDVSVVVRGTNTREYDLETFDQRVGTDPSRFAPGDSWRGPNEVGGDSLEILVVAEAANIVVGRESVAVAIDVIASFSTQPGTPAPGQTVTFDATASEAEGTNIDTYEWDFDDDGATDATGAVVQHSFATAGTYPVSLRVTTTAGDAAGTSTFVRVQSSDPTASFTYSPADPTTQDGVVFDGTNSDGGGQSIASYQWDFGDGATATGAQPTHSFDGDGSYDVTLTITNDAGATDATTQTVQVSNVAPTAEFETYLQDVRGGPDDEIVYDASNSVDPDGSIDRYQWDIDEDGAPEIDTDEPVVSRGSWFDPRTGEVTLTITDDDGATTTVTQDDEYLPTPGFEVFGVILAVLLGAGLRRRGYL